MRRCIAAASSPTFSDSSSSGGRQGNVRLQHLLRSPLSSLRLAHRCQWAASGPGVLDRLQGNYMYMYTAAPAGRLYDSVCSHSDSEKEQKKELKEFENLRGPLLLLCPVADICFSLGPGICSSPSLSWFCPVRRDIVRLLVWCDIIARAIINVCVWRVSFVGRTINS